MTNKTRSILAITDADVTFFNFYALIFWVSLTINCVVFISPAYYHYAHHWWKHWDNEDKKVDALYVFPPAPEKP